MIFLINLIIAVLYFAVSYALGTVLGKLLADYLEENWT